MNWNLINLDARKILCNLSKHDIKKDSYENYTVEFKYDLSDKNIEGFDIILSEDTFADNALFFQIRKILKANSKLEIDENFIRSTLLFVDFKEIFSNKYEKIWSSAKLPADIPNKADLLKEENLPYRMQLLFKDGLFLSFDGENFKRFVPFDKSSSMARNCQISFIDSQVKDILDKHLMLDINFVGKTFVPSKFYAYRGLYLSAASRINIKSKNFSLNEKTVIILPDYRAILPKIKVFTASEKANVYEYTLKEKTLSSKLFEGEGLISPDFAEYISNFLQRNCDYPKSSHSFQIRMPFTKGVLHEVDFNKFFAEYLPVESSEWLIKDVFGIIRDLRKAKIIFTESMFKCIDLIKDYSPDPMKYFFAKFAEYNHALYVINTEARLFNSGRVRLNYQFLSTLDLSDEDLNSLIADHHALIDSLAEKFSTNFSVLSSVQDFIDETYDDSEFDQIICRSSVNRTTCLKALAKNPAFFKDPKVKRIYEGLKKSYECNLGLGRLEIEGEQRFLSCDLLELLIKILENVEGVQLDDTTKNSLKEECLYRDRFFMPDDKLSIMPDKKYVFLRNPHLSRNEQVLLRAYVKRKSLHEKYFSHLKGVVMVSAKSTAAMALGGADFDGDLVKIIPDKRIVKAVEEGKIKKDLPLIEIPDVKSRRGSLSDNIPLQVIVDTFANKIGLISNWAVTLSDKEYFSETIEEKYKDACAKCTIIVGLEIDAAKNGKHPAENIKEIKNLVKDCGKNTFLESKKIIKQILQGHYSPIVKSEKNLLLLYFSKCDNKPKLKVSIEEGSSILERLPKFYLSYLKSTSEKLSDSESKLGREQKISQYFDFETSGWRKTLDKALSDKLTNLIKAYLDILRLNNKSQKSKSKKKFSGYIVNILKLQYNDYRYQKLPCGIEIITAWTQLNAELSAILKTDSRAKEAIELLKEQKWHFTCEEDRPRVAAKILGLNLSDDEKLPSSFEFLYNFRCNGFELFYFVLKDLDLENDFFDTLESDDNYYVDFNQNPYREEFHKTYSKLIKEKKSKRIWNAQLIKICRKHLLKIFSGDMSEALKYYWAQKSNDSSRNFFWNVFDEQEILSHIFSPKTQD